MVGNYRDRDRDRVRPSSTASQRSPISVLAELLLRPPRSLIDGLQYKVERLAQKLHKSSRVVVKSYTDRTTVQTQEIEEFR